MAKAAKKPTGYNGWTNYETWAVNLWLENEEGSYRYWRAEAQRHKEEHGARRTGKPRWGNAKVDLADHLKDELSEQAPDLGATLWSDLLSAALSEVNWYEIAEHLLEE